METNTLFGEKIAKTIKTKVNELYKLYVRYNIPLDELNEKEQREREIKRILESIRQNLNNYLNIINMWNRTFKKETIFVIFGEPWKNTEVVRDNRSIKKVIYAKGVRGMKYIVREIDDDGTLINEWEYKYLSNGIIFTKNIYSKWKEMKKEAKNSEINMFNF